MCVCVCAWEESGRKAVFSIGIKIDPKYDNEITNCRLFYNGQKVGHFANVTAESDTILQVVAAWVSLLLRQTTP